MPYADRQKRLEYSRIWNKEYYKKNKDFNLAQVKAWGWGKERIKKELKKCTVLCANCHRKIHAGLI